MTDDAWDAAASDRFNATFDRRAAEVDLIGTFRRLLAEYDQPVVIDLPPDLDAGLRDALIDEARTNQSVIIVDYRRPEPMHRALDLYAALGRMEAAVAHIPQEPPMLTAPAILAAASLSAGVPPMPGERDLFRTPTKAPKPPPEIQDAIQAAAEDRRDRKRVRNLRNIGHSADCAMDMAIGHRPCSCGKAGRQ